jgi:hypothetical protein
VKDGRRPKRKGRNTGYLKGRETEDVILLKGTSERKGKRFQEPSGQKKRTGVVIGAR